MDPLRVLGNVPVRLPVACGNPMNPAVTAMAGPDGRPDGAGLPPSAPGR